MDGKKFGLLLVPGLPGGLGGNCCWANGLTELMLVGLLVTLVVVRAAGSGLAVVTCPEATLTPNGLNISASLLLPMTRGSLKTGLRVD